MPLTLSKLFIAHDILLMNIVGVILVEEVPWNGVTIGTLSEI